MTPPSFTKLLLVALLCATPAVAHAGRKQKLEAKAHLKAATKAHKEGKFDEALSELQAAYALDPQPDTMFAIGQVQVKLDNCPEAIMSYQTFLESNPPDGPKDAANEAIQTCRDKIAASQPPPPPPEPAPPPPPPPPKPHHKAFYKDPLGDILVLAGVGGMAAGGYFYLGARSTLDDSEKAPTYADSKQLVDDAHGKRNIAIVCGSIGVVALGVGVWRYTRVGRTSHETSHERAVAVVPSRDGGMITWMGRF